MGTRGPKPQGLTILPAPKNKRKSPMPGMTKPACRIWTRIVGSYQPDHFKPQHYDMLESYCEAAALRKKATKEIEETGELIEQKNGVIKQNPYLQIYQNSCSIMAQLGTKLGITYNATTVSKGDTGHNTKPKSKREGLLFKG
jgi:P27 family predicted phage terminase small subunit